MTRFFKNFALVLLATLLLTIVAFALFVWWESSHCVEFTLDDRYEMELIADECLSCLLYWQFDFDMAIKDKNTGKKYHYHFVSPDGPSLKFLLSGRHPENILITGTGHSQGQAWLIDLQVDTIQFLKFNEAIQDSTYKTIAEFNDSFELVMKK